MGNGSDRLSRPNDVDHTQTHRFQLVPVPRKREEYGSADACVGIRYHQHVVRLSIWAHELLAFREAHRHGSLSEGASMAFGSKSAFRPVRPQREN